MYKYEVYGKVMKKSYYLYSDSNNINNRFGTLIYKNNSPQEILKNIIRNKTCRNIFDDYESNKISDNIIIANTTSFKEYKKMFDMEVENEILSNYIIKTKTGESSINKIIFNTETKIYELYIDEVIEVEEDLEDKKEETNKYNELQKLIKEYNENLKKQYEEKERTSKCTISLADENLNTNNNKFNLKKFWSF